MNFEFHLGISTPTGKNFDFVATGLYQFLKFLFKGLVMNNQTKNAYKLALAGMVALAFAGNANADERFPRWYIGLGLGLTGTQDSSISATGTNGDLSLDNGYTANASIGYMPPVQGTPGGPRVEAEVLFSEGDVGTSTVNGVSTSVNGRLRQTSYMVNALYDFNMNSSVMPYLGAGLGWGQVRLPKNSTLGNVTDQDNVFVWQLLTGIGYQPISLPYTVFNLGYRFHATGDSNFGTSTAGVNLSLDPIYTHSIEAGMKFRF